jgi:hypothetical protein
MQAVEIRITDSWVNRERKSRKTLKDGLEGRLFRNL